MGFMGWAGLCGRCVVGVGGFPLLRAPVSPNGGVAGFKQTFSAVAPINRPRRQCRVMAVVGPTAEPLTLGKEKFAVLSTLPALSDT